MSTRVQPHEYYDDGRRKVNLWSLVVPPQEYVKDMTRHALDLAKNAFEYALEVCRDELANAACGGREPARRDYRNGYYQRQSVATELGYIKGLRVPRCRNCSVMRAFAARLKQAQGRVEEKIVDLFLRGVSTRNVGELLRALTGLSVSAGQVSRLLRRLDAAVRRFHERPLVDQYEYLFLDGIYLKSRSGPRLFQSRCQARRRAVLVAYGVTRQGVKELVGFRVESGESAAGWRRFLLGLQRRGLAGEALRLIVTDGGAGLIEAVDDCFPEVAHQRCWFHKMANVSQKVRRRNRSSCLAGLRRVYTAGNRRQAEQAYGEWAWRWHKEEPGAVKCVEKDLESLLRFYARPRAHWRMVRTTNAIERCFREVRRRTNSIGCFINNGSLERIIYALFALFNRRRAGKMCREYQQERKVA